MNVDVLHSTTAGSLDGTMKFPQVVATLAAEGVESYRVDLVRSEKIFYSPCGQVHSESFACESAPIAPDFSGSAVVAAILASQAGEIGYPEFLGRIRAAGVTGYVVYIAGRRAIYTGRTGEFHVEEFPGK